MRPNSNEANGNNRTFDKENSEPKIRIIKLGGSLFSLADLRGRLLQFLKTTDASHWVNVWIPGGGPMVDEIRNWQQRHGLHDDAAHAISLQTLGVTARLFQELMDGWPLVNCLSDLTLAACQNSNNIIFACTDWADRCPSLPRSWATTSDSIALQLANEVNADQLILLKSICSVSDTIASNRQQGVIDENFGNDFKRGGRPEIFIVNLRQSLKSTKLNTGRSGDLDNIQ